ncbi:hypothetical protein [Mesorhizobium sp.]|uniref:hypothetical protein n=1 Tax=Mesorhizobium sp. TaxID=1871066 RepID=UPI000FE8FABB|nr:hypothetical protein [Mesorhizobium sp.]RWM07064.1 MAG: hypothetical protein EOR71_17390 [Mesorhizobium sp.]
MTLLLFPMAVGGYEQDYIAYRLLVRDKMLVDCHLKPEDLPMRGIKYSCFDQSSALGLAEVQLKMVARTIELSAKAR